MKRIPEPDLMNDPEHVVTYAGNHLDMAYQMLIWSLTKLFPEVPAGGAILDLGCGPAALPLRLASTYPHCEIHGIDGAQKMLDLGREAVRRQGLTQRIKLFHGVLPGNLPLARQRYEMVVSNYLLHHLADPMMLWGVLERYCLAGGAVLISDLLRPPDREAAEEVVEKYMPKAPPLLKDDMLQSLCSSYTMEEIREQLEKAGLSERLNFSLVSTFQFAVHGHL